MHTLLLTALLIGRSPEPVNFDTDVLPVLTKAGCNAASCHGAAAGRGGFKLSLFAGDPERDFHAIVHQLESRRVNLADPPRSLVVLKPTGELEHEGGVRIEPDSAGAETLLAWIQQGAERISKRRLTRFDVEPSEVVLARPMSFDRLHVYAHFDDGLRRDVTKSAVYYPDDPAALQADAGGKIKVLRRGRHTLVVRYLSKVTTLQVTVPLADEPIDLAAQPRNNWIDDEILQTLETLRVPPSPQADRRTLLRRAFVDLTGRLPRPEDTAPQAQDDAGEYEKLVDRLLDSDEFTEYWTYKLATLLRIRAQPQEKRAAQVFHNWVRQQLDRATPWDKMAAALLMAEGDTHVNGPANFHRVAGDARKQAEYVSELLMGARMRCANCHNHPLDRWTQDDYHGLSAVFARIDRGRVVRLNPNGQIIHPATGLAALPKIPGGHFLDKDGDPRKALAQWMTAGDNPYFAKAIVNRLWKAMMGRGLVEPPDDLRATNPPTHPRLLDRLAKDFVEHDYDLRHTLRLIATSAAYARSSRTTENNRADDRFYSHALTRPLEPEVLADALADVTGVPDRYGDEPLGTRAVALFDTRTTSAALDILGRCSRQDSCEAGGSAAGGLTTKLHLINGELINRKIAAKSGRLQMAMAAGRSHEQIVEEFYRRALSRPPSDKERAFWNKQLDGVGQQERRRRLEDFLWSLLSCREFATNH